MTARARSQKAWLITWEWASDAAAVEDAVAAILNPRISERQVAWFVEQLYAIHTSNLQELAAIAKHPKRNPYRSSREGGLITCGHNPLLEARLVDNLRISVDDESGLETIQWEERPLYRGTEAGPEKVRGLISGSFARRRTGPVSAQPVWDRMAGAFRSGWEDYEGVIHSGHR